MTDKRVCVAFGTRPEASKMAPVVQGLAATSGVTPLVLVTGQHRQQLDSMLELFNITPDADLDVMQARQSLPDLLGRVIPAAAEALQQLQADYVLVHGDTTTTFAVAMAAYLEGIPVAHVEAGLRSFNLQEPFPEEANRRLVDVLTDLDLPPTPLARANLLAEGKSATRMVVTGNTAVDAVHLAAERACAPAHLPEGPLVAITMHRRENLPVMEKLAAAIAATARAWPDVTFVYPVHLNPAVRDAVRPALTNLPNVLLEEPYDYVQMLGLLQRSRLIITDSGGIQEEAAALGIPVAVLRNVTERPEGLEAGTLRLIGNDGEQVRRALTELLGDEDALAGMRNARNPYGDGKAGLRVAQAVAWRLGLAERPADWL